MKIKQAIKIIGGQSETARRLGVAQSNVHRWHSGKAKIPAEYALEVEHLTSKKITRVDLRPDLRW
ncbi:MAG: helix-turn-helix domain-containing protein [Rhizobiales bacterium]|nr:helix-turn-helix domain-containing protein [Hyphomicrobiales bacterium]NRB13065.1 helix-turn-helix domain-containing protein [Hyphomicrobiales bacterium]